VKQVNRDRVGTFTLTSEGGYRDIALLGDCDKSVTDICELCSWTKDFNKLLSHPGEAAGSKGTASDSRSAATLNSTPQVKEKTAFLSSTPSRSTPPKHRTSASAVSSKQSSTSKRASHHKQTSSPYRK